MVPAGRETQHRPVEFGGPGEAFVRTVANLAYGGQVVLTERAWVSVQDHIPGQAQVTMDPCHQASIARLDTCIALLRCSMCAFKRWVAGLQ